MKWADFEVDPRVAMKECWLVELRVAVLVARTVESKADSKVELRAEMLYVGGGLL